MAKIARVADGEAYRVMAEAYTINDRMNQMILEHLDPHAWRAKLPGDRGRTIAAIFAHMHNIRRKWLRLSAPSLKLPELNRARCSPKEVQRALAESAARCSEMLAGLSTSLSNSRSSPRSKVAMFRRDGWARPWPAGAAMFAYMITHDAHHRGQVCWLARELGYPLPQKVAYTMWNWEKLWKECGFGHPR